MPRILPSESHASESQIAANRANAQNSTGPRTAEGKARSRQNALKHGLTAKCPVLPSEDPAEFTAFVDALFEDLTPCGATEALLVDQISVTAWRLKGAPDFEAGLMTYVAAHEARSHDDGPHPDTANREASKIGEKPAFPFPALDDAYRVGRMLRVMLDQDQISKLSRYEAGLQKQLRELLRDLGKLQDSRRARAPDLHQRDTIANAEILVPHESVNGLEEKGGRITCAEPALDATAREVILD
jgi:hypothetical protein